MNRQICVSFFDTVSEGQFWEHPSLMGSKYRVKKVKPGDIVLIYNKDTHCVDGIAILDAIENGKIYRTARRPLYSEEYAKYNTFEIGVKSFRIQPVPLQTINRECGLDVDSKIIKCLQNKSFVRNPTLAPWANRILIDAMIAEYI